MMGRWAITVTLMWLFAGCTTVRVFHETPEAIMCPAASAAESAAESTVAQAGVAALEAGTATPACDPSVVQWWRTETRRQWRWWGAPVWKTPEDIYFSTQETCERFRLLHPDYTRPDEVCQPVRGQLSTRPTWRR